MDGHGQFVVQPIGVVRATLRTPADAPNQAFEAAPGALLDIDPAYKDALHPDGKGTLSEQRLHQLIRQRGSIADRTFEISFSAAGAEAYCFTFG